MQIQLPICFYLPVVRLLVRIARWKKFSHQICLSTTATSIRIIRMRRDGVMRLEIRRRSAAVGNNRALRRTLTGSRSCRRHVGVASVGLAQPCRRVSKIAIQSRGSFSTPASKSSFHITTARVADMAAGGEIEGAGLHTFFGDGLKLAFGGTYVHQGGQT